MYFKNWNTWFTAITNIPYGVTYTVVEDNYTTEGYNAADYSFDDANKTIDSAQDTVTITNEKNGMIDTGIYMDSLPYVLALALIFGFGAVLFIRRRRVSEWKWKTVWFRKA